MTYRHELITRVLAQRVVGIVRTPSTEAAFEAVRLMREAGLASLEITLNTPGALDVIAATVREHPDAVVGAGTVLDEASVAAAVRAGAEFVVSPDTRPAVIRAAHCHGVPALPGAATPTEVLTALSEGADAVKIFPAAALGVGWLTDVRAAIPQAPYVPTGGITLSDVPDWLAAGAVACGLGSALTKGDPDGVRTDLARLVGR